MGLSFDWSGVLHGDPPFWLAIGLLMTVVVSLVGALLASVVAVVLTFGRAVPFGPSRVICGAIVSIFRDSPLVVQLLAWYFAAWNALPVGLKTWVLADHPWAVLPGDVVLLSPEFIAAAVGLGVFGGVFVCEEIRAGLAAVPAGQREAALSQGMAEWTIFRRVLLPQGLANAAQPVIGQYLNLMKLSSLASAIGLAEITYQVRQIESYNSHALEAFAVGTLLYLALGLALSQALSFVVRRRAPRRRSPSADTARLETEEALP